MHDFRRFVFVVLERRPGNNIMTHGVFESSEEAMEVCRRIRPPFSGPEESVQAWVAMTQYRPTAPTEP